MLDPGFRSLTGHHNNNNLSITAAAKDEVAFRILAGDSWNPHPPLDAWTRPHFRTDLYEGIVTHQSSWEFDCWMNVNVKFAQDLARIPNDDIAWADLILVPAITQFHMLALARWLAEKLPQLPELRAVVQLMFSPTWTSWDAVCHSGPQMYAEAISLLEPFRNRQLFYCSELEASCKEFEPLVGGPISVLPHPGIWDEAPATGARGGVDGPITLGYFGYAKREKGFHLLPDIVRAVRAKFGPSEARFFLHVNHGAYDPDIIRADELLHGMVDEGIELRVGAMAQGEYIARFQEADVMLLPYDPELYRGRGSGVFSEAIGYGKVVIAPRSAGVGDEILAGHGSGVLFNDHTAESVSSAVLHAIRNAAALVPLAQRSAAPWRRRHSGEGFLSVLNEVLS